MKRRVFLRLAGIAAAFGLPSVVGANQDWVIKGDEKTFSRTVTAIQSPEDLGCHQAVIKVVGVGGAGCNAVQHMIQSEMPGGEFICINTDAQTLSLSSARTKIFLGHDFSTLNRERKSIVAIDHHEYIAGAIKGADIVFITAGMGGETGTAVSPMVAELARELGILTVAVVSMPFSFEGRRVRTAELGLVELSRHVDAHILIDSDSLLEMLGDDVSMAEAFAFSYMHIGNAIGGITGIFSTPGFINLDFKDVQNTLSSIGRATMGFATARGDNRAILATEGALNHPLMRRDTEKCPKERVLFNITAQRHISPKEVVQVIQTIQRHASAGTTVLGGSVYDDSMGDQMRVTVFAS